MPRFSTTFVALMTRKCPGRLAGALVIAVVADTTTPVVATGDAKRAGRLPHRPVGV